MKMLLKKIHVSDVKTVARPGKHSQNKANSFQINKQSILKKSNKIQFTSISSILLALISNKT